MGSTADRQHRTGGGTGDGSDGPVGTRRVYREMLRAPLWWYPVAGGVAAILAAEFHLADVSITDWLPYLILVPLALFIVWWVGRQRLEIADGEVRIRDARLPLSVVSGVVGLDTSTLRRVVGREGDPAAYVAIRPWIGPGVQLWLDDPNDPVPYWVVSTRRPERVVALLRQAGAG